MAHTNVSSTWRVYRSATSARAAHGGFEPLITAMRKRRPAISRMRHQVRGEAGKNTCGIDLVGARAVLFVSRVRLHLHGSGTGQTPGHRVQSHGPPATEQ